MKRKFSIAKSILPWMMMIAFMVVGVVASQAIKVDFNSNLKFVAKDVKATIVVQEAFAETNDVEEANFEIVETIVLDERNQTVEKVDLGTAGTIEFTSLLKVYILKISITNNFSEGGRSILVDFYLNYLDDMDAVEVEIDSDLPFGADGVVLQPDEKVNLVITVELTPDSAESFDTSSMENFELLSVFITRI